MTAITCRRCGGAEIANTDDDGFAFAMHEHMRAHEGETARILNQYRLAVVVWLAKYMHGNGLLESREDRGELEPWEVCTCVDGGDPPWHLLACPRDVAEYAAQQMRGVKP